LAPSAPGDGFRETGLLGMLARLALVATVAAILLAAAFPAPRLLYSYNLEHFAAFYLLAIAAAVANPKRRLRDLTAALLVFAFVIDAARLFWSPPWLVLQRWCADVGGVMAGYAPIVAERIRRRIQPAPPAPVPPPEVP
jgi:hypothetical protein